MVDGHVTRLGGDALREHIEALGLDEYYDVIAHAVAPAYSQERGEAWREDVGACYSSALRRLWFPANVVAPPSAGATEKGWWRGLFESESAPAPSWHHQTPSRVIATPLLGAGAKLAPIDEAVGVAAGAMALVEPPVEPALGATFDGAWVVRFGVLEAATAEALAQAFREVAR